jgi:NodT family efflux transporter outer membrane factor (OMF) lipoprotein
MVMIDRWRAGLVALTLTTVSCASVRRVDVPVPKVPDVKAWSEPAEHVATTTDVQDLAHWWTQLGDSTMSDIIEQALLENRDVRTAAARVRQARAELLVTKSDLYPTVSASASVSDSRSMPGIFTPGFDASWEPDVFGGARQSINAAAADVNATVEDLHNAQVSLVGEIARNYVDLRTSQARLAIARENEASQAETLQLTSFRSQAGLVSSVDVEQARSNLEQTRAQIPSLEASIEQQIHRIAVLSGLQPAALGTRLATAAPIPTVPANIAVGIPSETLRNRPDVRAAEQRIVAETARLASAETNRYPKFTLSGSIGVEIVSGVLTGGTSAIASAAGKVAQTLFDGGRIRNQIAVQSGVQQQRVLEYEGTVLTALEDVENALVSFEKARVRLASLTAASEAALNAASLAQTQYTAGLADFQRVLDTQRTVLSVEDSVAVTEGDRVLALVQLFKALGGGWTTTADESTTGSTRS